MVDLNDYNPVTAIDKEVNKIASSNTLTEVGIDGFTLFARVSDNLTLSSKSPDIPLEDGSTVQDNITLDPITIKIDGVVGDVFIKSNVANEYLRKGNALLGQYSTYLPPRTKSQIQKANELINDFNNKAAEVGAVFQSVNNVLAITGDNSSNKSNQQKFIDKMTSLYTSKKTIPIQIANKLYKNMRIATVSITTSNESKAINFSIQVKQLIFAKTITTDASKYFPSPSKGINGKTSGQVEKGVQTGKKVESSLFSTLLGRG